MTYNPEEFRFRTHYLGDFATEPKLNYAKRYADAVAKLADLQKKQDEGKKLGSVQAKDIVELPNLIEVYEKDKDKVNFSATAANRIRSCVDQAKYNIIYNLDNKYVTKGLVCEDDSIALNKKLEGVPMTKNKTRIQNHLIAGEWDIDWQSKTLGKVTDDIKTAYSKDSFNKINSLKSIYYWQGTGYMWLNDSDYARIVHVLVNTPPDLIITEHNNMLYKHKPKGMTLEDFSFTEEGTQIRTQFFRNHTYTDHGWVSNYDGSSEYLESGYWDYLVETQLLDSAYQFTPIPDNQRRKVFQFKRNNDDIQWIENKLKLAKNEFLRLYYDDSPMIYNLEKDDFE